MAGLKVDALLVTDINNVFYLSGFTGSTAAVLVTGDSSTILVDPRYSVQARKECPQTEVRDFSNMSLCKAASGLIAEAKPGIVGFESDNLTVTAYRDLRKQIDRATKLKGTRGVIGKLRMVKDLHEIELIRLASEISDATFDAVCREVKPGMTEREIAIFIDFTMRKLGASKPGFDTIAAAGPGAAEPHHQPTDAVLEKGQMLKLDFGATRAKYNSDLTRTIFFGEPDAKQREVYQIVLDALLQATAAIAPGKTGKEIDAVARDYITSKGYGDKFGHGLGHSLGIVVHDGPGFSTMSEIILEPGMVITVEPGIYIEGWGGVRIEDDIVVTETGVEVITKAEKGLVVV